MQAIDLKSSIGVAVAEVLESMCFISSEGEATEEVEQFAPNWICGELDFVGRLSGTFGVAVPPSTAATIASNFLGEDDSTLSAEQTKEVIGELTNMICGSLLARLDPKNTFTLSPPRPGRTNEHGPRHGERSHCMFALDEGHIFTWLDIRPNA